MNFNLKDGHTIFLSRHGESEYNVDHRIGGNPPLTTKGQGYAKDLAGHINNLCKFIPPERIEGKSLEISVEFKYN